MGIKKPRLGVDTTQSPKSSFADFGIRIVENHIVDIQTNELVDHLVYPSLFYIMLTVYHGFFHNATKVLLNYLLLSLLLLTYCINIVNFFVNSADTFLIFLPSPPNSWVQYSVFAALAEVDISPHFCYTYCLIKSRGVLLW